MIFDIYVTCGGGGVTLFDGLGPLFESYTESTGLLRSFGWSGSGRVIGLPELSPKHTLYLRNVG